PPLISLLSERQGLSCEHESEQLVKIQSVERQSPELAKGEVEMSEMSSTSSELAVTLKSNLGQIVSSDEIDLELDLVFFLVGNATLLTSVATGVSTVFIYEHFLVDRIGKLKHVLIEVILQGMQSMLLQTLIVLCIIGVLCKLPFTSVVFTLFPFGFLQTC
ncbi:hypothetical protein ACR2XN_29225, partial [Klebsiella pneumoniae]